MPNYMHFCAIPPEVLFSTLRISVFNFFLNCTHLCLLRFEKIRTNHITMYFSGLLCAGWCEDTETHKTSFWPPKDFKFS